MRWERLGEVVDEKVVVELGEDVEVFFCMSAYDEGGPGLRAGSEGAFEWAKVGGETDGIENRRDSWIGRHKV